MATSQLPSSSSSSSIGKGLVRAFILSTCLRSPTSGYRLMSQGKEILLTNWSAGSFYPHIYFLLKEGMLERSKTASKRVTYEYKTTPKGRAYLQHVSTYFKNPILRAFFAGLMSGDFDA